MQNILRSHSVAGDKFRSTIFSFLLKTSSHFINKESEAQRDKDSKLTQVGLGPESQALIPQKALKPFPIQPTLSVLGCLFKLEKKTKDSLNINCCCSVAQLCPNSVTPWTAACQASLSLTISQSLPKFMSIASVMPSSHLIL